MFFHTGKQNLHTLTQSHIVYLRFQSGFPLCAFAISCAARIRNRTNRGSENAVAHVLHAALSHLEGWNTYKRMLVMAYSSAP